MNTEFINPEAINNEFINAMNNSGINCLETIKADGELHRFANGGKGKKNAWYILFENGGAYGDWKLNINEKWHKDNHNNQYSKADTQLITAKIAKGQAEYQQELAKQYEVTAKKSLHDWNRLPTTGTSEYLQRKLVNGYDIKYGKAGIGVPLYDINGKLWNLQIIYHNGKKIFQKGGKKKGCFHVIGSIDGNDSNDTAYIAEGYSTAATIHMATGKTVIIAFDAGNIESVTAAIKAKYPLLNLIIAADNDQWRDVNIGKIKAEAVAKQYNCQVILPKFPTELVKSQPTDWNDLHVLAGLEAVTQQLLSQTSKQSSTDLSTEITIEQEGSNLSTSNQVTSNDSTPTLKSINIEDFLAMDIKPQEMILAPIIPKQGVCMIYAYRGIGKTHIALAIAYAVATGGHLLKWQAPIARPVLYIDGEMPAISIQQRLAREFSNNNRKNSDNSKKLNPDYFRIITPDLQDYGIPSLTSCEGQQAINKLLDGVELVIIDNISTLCRGGRENESESWVPIQEWALYLRKRGISVLFIHHAGKNNKQRGASKREDIMDTVISLKRPEDYKTSEGARFEVHYEKSRGFTGADATAFEAWLKTDTQLNDVSDNIDCNMDDNHINHHHSAWQVRAIIDKDTEQTQQVILLHQEGVSQRFIAKETGFSLGKINKIIQNSNIES
ncbi:MAG: AAA family ATPase [Pseudomonadota bacterium]